MSPNMTTFSTRNQSRKRLVTLLMAGIFVLLLVTVIVMYKRHKHDQMYRSNDQTQTAAAARGRSRNPLLPGTSDSTGNSASSTNSLNEPLDNAPKNPFYKETEHVSPIVSIPQNGGPIKGQLRRTSEGKVVSSFLGVPYASPPVEALRFEPPSNVKKWSAIKEAFYQPAKCPQGAYLFSSITESRADQSRESEDCLYLNIWTPTGDFGQPTKKPVLVYFHSGLFSFGSIGTPDLDPTNLTITHEIVVVTVQYRLGAFGFGLFESDNKAAELTSLGIQDQAKALEWIKANIGAFGGDPERVTVSGHGAGAIAIGAHLMNPKTNKYFHRVIVQGIHNIWNIGLYGMASQASLFFVNDLGCDLSLATTKSVRKCLKKNKVNINSAIETQHFMMERFAVPFGPEFMDFTVEVAKKMADIEVSANITGKPTMEQLKMIFNNWNIFPKHIEFMIGLNSDDDYKLETINRNNSKITFDDDEEDDEDDSSEAVSVNENGSAKSTNQRANLKAQKSSDYAEVEGVEEEGITEAPTTGENVEIAMTSEKTLPMSTTIALAITTETPPTRSSIQRRRKRLLRRRDTTSLVDNKNQISLDEDEIMKLCRLVNFYRQQKALNDGEVSSAMYLYRVDPKVLNSPLEEVNLAFGSRQKSWLMGFDEKLMNLWGSFVKMGDFSQINKIGLDYHSHLHSLDSDKIELINLGQEEDNTHEKMPNDALAHKHQSELKIATVDNLKQLCV